MIDKVLKTIDKFNMINENDFIVAGVSGGADSVCLLHILKKISGIFNLKIAVVHINHGIRGEDADNDQKYVEKLCEDMRLDFFPFFVNIRKEAEKLSVSEEEAGRIFRYKCFYDVLNKYGNGKIAVAHNKNDNAETIIMRFIRGTGIKGLCGIPPVRDNIIRPLIDCERYEIENYCKENCLEFKTDYTNEEDIYTRNKIRINLIPWISKNLNENIISSLVKNSRIISEEESFLEELAEKAFYKCVCNNDFQKKAIIDTQKLKVYDDVIKRRVIRKACRFFSMDLHDLSYNHINMIINLSENTTGKKLFLPSGIYAEKKYGKLEISLRKKTDFNEEKPYFERILSYDKIEEITEAGYRVILTEKECLFREKPCFSICIDKNKISGSIKIRRRAKGDRIFVKNVGRKKLKNIFSEKKIGEEERKKILIVCDEKNVIAAAGICVSDLYKLKGEGEKANIYFWRTDAL